MQFFNKDETIGRDVGKTRTFSTNPEFQLGSLPSHDKKKLYEHVAKTFQPGLVETIEVDVEVDVIAGDGETIHTWKYRDCSIRDYSVFLEFDNTLDRWSNEEGPEIQELFVFFCEGIDLST